jgi:dCTP deaminase
MILSDKAIKKAIEDHRISIYYDNMNDLRVPCIQPASLDIRLGRSFAIPNVKKWEVIRFDESMSYKYINQESFILAPGDFVLGTTMERIKIANDLTAFVEGRSSIGRLGICVQNAGWVDPGFEGEITLELYNMSNHPIELISGARVAQLVFAQMDQEAENPYTGKYQGQKGATGTLLFKDFPQNSAKYYSTDAPTYRGMREYDD